MIISTTRRALQIVASLGITAACLAASTGVARAHSDDGDGPGGVAGAYAVQVTLRDCATNAPLGPPFDSLVSLHAGGTITESAGGRAFAPGQRSPGHGHWTRIGRRTYRQEMVALVVFDTAANLPGTPTFDPTQPVTPGFFAGWVTVSHTLTFTDATHATSSGTNAFYKLTGERYRTGCSSAVARRLAR